MELKTRAGRVVFEYVTKKPENIGLISPSAAYFDPVRTPSGERVSNAAPNETPGYDVVACRGSVSSLECLQRVGTGNRSQR
jgi:hypothetical protein